MDTPKSITLQFECCQDVELKFLKEIRGRRFYEETKREYDLQLGESSTLTIMLEVRPMTDIERRSTLLRNAFLRKGHHPDNPQSK
jgi:hypothetical protein